MVLCIAMYICAIVITSLACNESPETFRIFSRAGGNGNLSLMILKFLAVFSGISLIYFFPGLIFILIFSEKQTVEYFRIKVFLTSMLIVIPGFILSRLFIGDPGRISFLFIETAILLSGIIFMPKESFLSINISFSLNKLIPVLFSICILAALMLYKTDKVVFYRSLDYDYSQRGTLAVPMGLQDDTRELFGVTASLKKHIFPYWDLEYADRFGYLVIDYPFYAYINSVVLAVFGGTFGSISFINLFYLALISILILEMADIDKEDRRTKFVHFIPVIVLSSFISLLLKEPDNFVAETHLFTLFLLMSSYFLLKGEQGLFLFSAFLAFLQKISGSVLIVLELFAALIFLNPKRGIIGKLVLRYAAAIVIYFVFIVMIICRHGYLPAYIERFLQENFYRFDYFGIMKRYFAGDVLNAWPKFSVHNTLDFLVWFMCGSGLTGIFLFLKKKDNISQYFSFIGVSYFILVLISMHKKIYFVEPLVFLAAIAAMRYLNLKKKHPLPE